MKSSRPPGYVFVGRDTALTEAAGTRIRLLMRRRRVTQAELVRRTWLTGGVVSRALRDPTRAKLATLRAIATALDARFADLLAEGRGSHRPADQPRA